MRKTFCQILFCMVFILTFVVNINMVGAADSIRLPSPWDKVKELAITRGQVEPPGCNIYRLQGKGIEVAFVYCQGDDSVAILNESNQKTIGMGVEKSQGKRITIWVDWISGRASLISNEEGIRVAYTVFRALVEQGLL